MPCVININYVEDVKTLEEGEITRFQGINCRSTKPKELPGSALERPKHHPSDQNNVLQRFQVMIAYRKPVLDTSNHSNQHFNFQPDPHFAQIPVLIRFIQSFDYTFSQ